MGKDMFEKAGKRIGSGMTAEEAIEGALSNDSLITVSEAAECLIALAHGIRESGVVQAHGLAKAQGEAFALDLITSAIASLDMNFRDRNEA